MNGKFQFAEFQNKMYIHHSSVYFYSDISVPGDFMVSDSDGSEIQASVEYFRPIN